MYINLLNVMVGFSINLGLSSLIDMLGETLSVTSDLQIVNVFTLTVLKMRWSGSGTWSIPQSLKLNLVPPTQILGLFCLPKKRFCVFTPNYLSNKLLMLYYCVLFVLFTIACIPTLF